MSTKTKPKPGPVDPAETHNKRILAEIAARAEEAKSKKGTPVLDLLGVHVDEPKPAASAAEFVRDEFDKQNFGTPKTTTRVLYGPDNLLRIPYFKQQIEERGLDEFAGIVFETIMLKEEMAFPDPLLRKGIRQGVLRYGKEAIAKSFADRILQIPSKIVNIDVDTGDDDEVLGHPLEDAVRRYGNPGMSQKFLSERCIALLGKRGYQIVIDPDRGDPVKVGTLILGEIPERIAARRRAKYAEESNQNVKDANENYIAAQERFLEKSRDVPAEKMTGVGFLPAGVTLEGRDSDNVDPITLGLQMQDRP
jgi:hypothetical protein